MNWLWFTIGYFLSVIFSIVFYWIVYLYQVYRIVDKENHCNYCECSVLELDAKYCPRCGRQLTLHKENLEYLKLLTRCGEPRVTLVDEQALEHENQLEYYDDEKVSGYYDDNGCFIVCEEYGTDEELGRYSVEVQNGDGYYDSTGKFRRYKN